MKKYYSVKAIDQDSITFENGAQLYSNHRQDCCEIHYLSFSDLTLKDFEGLKFDLSKDTFFKPVEDYGIELIPIKGHSIRVPGYGYNNGYYSSNLTLCLTGGGINKGWDISSCQTISG